MSNDRRFKDRIVLVTGASRGLGRSIALSFAEEGAHLLLIARSVSALEALGEEIRELGSEFTVMPVDLRDGEKVDALGGLLDERFGRLDVFIGNAGILGPLLPVRQLSTQDWCDVLSINLTANWRLCRTLEPVLRKSDAGRAILVSSGASLRCRPNWGPYSITKAGVNALGQTWAAELEGTAVTVNVLAPGPVRTAMRAAAYPDEDPMAPARGEDVARMFLEFADPAHRTTGEMIDYRQWVGRSS